MKIKTTLKTNTGLFNVPYPPSPLTEKREKGMILDNFWKLFRIKREKELKIGLGGGAGWGSFFKLDLIGIKVLWNIILPCTNSSKFLVIRTKKQSV